MPTVTINQEGGLVIANASSVPTGHTIQMSSNQPWMKVYKNNQASAAASATSNTSASGRSCTVSVTATTTTNTSYNPTSVSVTCAWTVTQAGTGSTTTSYRFALFVQNSINSTLAFAVSTSPNSAGILASGTVTHNSSETAFDVILPLTSSTQPLYLLVATESDRETFVLGWGTSPSCVQGCWLPSQVPAPITTYTSMQWVVPGPNAAPANGTTWANLSGNIAIYAMYT